MRHDLVSNLILSLINNINKNEYYEKLNILKNEDGTRRRGRVERRVRRRLR